MCREEQLVLSLLITITVPVFLKVSFVFTSVFAQTPLRKVLIACCCAKSLQSKPPKALAFLFL